MQRDFPVPFLLSPAAAHCFRSKTRLFEFEGDKVPEVLEQSGGQEALNYGVRSPSSSSSSSCPGDEWRAVYEWLISAEVGGKDNGKVCFFPGLKLSLNLFISKKTFRGLLGGASAPSTEAKAAQFMKRPSQSCMTDSQTTIGDNKQDGEREKRDGEDLAVCGKPHIFQPAVRITLSQKLDVHVALIAACAAWELTPTLSVRRWKMKRKTHNQEENMKRGRIEGQENYQRVFFPHLCTSRMGCVGDNGSKRTSDRMQRGILGHLRSQQGSREPREKFMKCLCLSEWTSCKPTFIQSPWVSSVLTLMFTLVYALKVIFMQNERNSFSNKNRNQLSQNTQHT